MTEVIIGHSRLECSYQVGKRSVEVRLISLAHPPDLEEGQTPFSKYIFTRQFSFRCMYCDEVNRLTAPDILPATKLNQNEVFVSVFLDFKYS